MMKDQPERCQDIRLKINDECRHLQSQLFRRHRQEDYKFNVSLDKGKPYLKNKIKQKELGHCSIDMVGEWVMNQEMCMVSRAGKGKEMNYQERRTILLTS
jgi:phage anti-repressor protein